MGDTVWALPWMLAVEKLWVAMFSNLICSAIIYIYKARQPTPILFTTPTSSPWLVRRHHRPSIVHWATPRYVVRDADFAATLA